MKRLLKQLEGIKVKDVMTEGAIYISEFCPVSDAMKLLAEHHITGAAVTDEDERVVGLVAKIGASPMGLALIQEIRDAVAAFANNGKFAVAYAETFGEVGPGNGAYYLATAFNEIYLQPSGDVGLTGLMYECPFVRGTLDKLHVEPRIDHRKEFKNAKKVY